VGDACDDSDGDGFIDAFDTCPSVPNDQYDTDGAKENRWVTAKRGWGRRKRVREVVSRRGGKIPFSSQCSAFVIETERSRASRRR
jgi:hypothetical protein